MREHQSSQSARLGFAFLRPHQGPYGSLGNLMGPLGEKGGPRPRETRSETQFSALGKGFDCFEWPPALVCFEWPQPLGCFVKGFGPAMCVACREHCP